MSLSRKLAEPTLHEYMRKAEDDRDGWAVFIRFDATLEDPVGAPVLAGAEAIAAFWDRIHQGYGHALRASTVSSCAATKPWMILAAATAGAGVEMRVQIADLFTFNEQGKIATMRAFWDDQCMSMAS